MAARERRTVFVLLVLGGALAVAGCSSGGGGGTCAVSGVGVGAQPTSVAANQASTLTATVTSSGTCNGGVNWTATPTGGTLTPNGLTATFSAASGGPYTVTATSKDDSTKFGSAQVTISGTATACGTANGTVVTHASNITASETWAGDGTTHSVTTAIHIKAPATVTVEPCAIVQLNAGVTIYVDGVSGGAAAKLLAAGTDDATGFIAFLPATAGQPWDSLRATNEQSFIELHHTLLASAGIAGNFARYSAIVADGPGNFLLPVGTVTLDHVEIDNPVGGGVFLDSNAAFTTGSTLLGVKGATDYSVAMNMMALGSLPQYDDLGGNAHDDVLVVGASFNVYGDLTITNHMPVRIVTASMSVAPPANSALTSVTLTVQAGAQLRFAKPVANTPGARVYFGTVGQGASNKAGTLIAVGDTAPILFTSGESTKAAGDWSGLFLLTADGSQLSNVTVEYAGAFSGIVSANCRPTGDADYAGVIVGSDSYIPAANLIQNSTIQHNAGFGIDAVWTQSSGAYNSPDLSVGNAFNDNLYCSQSCNGVSGAGNHCPTGGCCTAQ